MFHVLRVSRALVAANPTRLCAGLDDRSSDRGLELDLPGEQISRRCADVGAVEVEAQAADKHLDVLLAEACVRAGRAALSAVEARVDATAQNSGLDNRLAWMGLDHLLRVSHRISSGHDGANGAEHVSSPAFEAEATIYTARLVYGGACCVTIRRTSSVREPIPSFR
jgi:hypothetical protein